MTGAEIQTVDRVDTLTERTYAQLRRALMGGAFLPGQKITIRTIAAALGVSPTPARDALNRLVAERALELGANRTVFVPKLTRARIREIYRIRLALEAMAAEAAVPHIGPDTLAELEDLQLRIVGAMDRKDYKSVLRENERFHFTVYQAAQQPILCQIIESLWLQIGPAFNFLYPEFDQTRKGVNAHLALMNALRSRDPAATRAAIELDLHGGEERLLRFIESNPEAGAGKGAERGRSR
ncbi:GntR family transcriptional regulator [Marinibaculum pumilum]|uniref:GntR family transcriptional regulator n=1 Tax=Marinibaculum pumilum TaxID=1766165 RepID=A0ABV7L5C3_9PROT